MHVEGFSPTVGKHVKFFLWSAFALWEPPHHHPMRVVPAADDQSNKDTFKQIDSFFDSAWLPISGLCL